MDPVSKLLEPLAGSRESVNGHGLVPIMIGDKAFDTESGQLAPICGIRKDPKTGVVVAVTQDPSGHAGSARRDISRAVVRAVCCFGLVHAQYHDPL